MTDDTRDDDTRDDEQTDATPRDRRGALRQVLIAIIVLLLLGMAALGYFFLSMLKPAGAPKTQAGGGLEWVRSIYGFGPATSQQLLDPTSVAIAPNGDIYVNDPQRSRVMRFASDGSFKSLVQTTRGAGRGQFYLPAGISTDGDGNLYIADPNLAKILVFNDQGTFVREWKTERPYGVKVRGEDVFVMTNGVVTVFDRSGANKGSFGRRGSGRDQIDAGQGMATDGKNVYIADALNHRISAYTRQGDVVWVKPDVKPGVDARSANIGTGTADPKTPYDLPQDIVLDGAGRLVVIDAFKFQLIVVAPKDGKVLASYGDYGSEDGLFFYPTSIDYDAARDWFAIADTRNSRVQIVRIPGSGESAAATARRLLTSPYRYCALPLLLALLATIAAITLRRRRRQAAPEEA